MDEILRALRVFCVPGQVVEMRALDVGGRKAVCEIHGDLEDLARRAAELDGAGAKGVYFTPNPLRPDLAGSKASSRAADVIERHWLLIDVDPYRPAGLSSTEAEIRAAWGVLDRCRSTLEAAGFRQPVVGFSGNGWHLCYRVLLPNDQASQDRVKAVLKGLQERCGDTLTDEETAGLKEGRPLDLPRARVDTSTHDANRIWKTPGTTARKGPSTPDRPHRRAFLVEVS